MVNNFLYSSYFRDIYIKDFVQTAEFAKTAKLTMLANYLFFVEDVARTAKLTMLANYLCSDSRVCQKCQADDAGKLSFFVEDVARTAKLTMLANYLFFEDVISMWFF